MRLYTEAHVTMVFIFGILNGIMGVFILSELKNGYRVTKILLKMAIRPYMRYLRRKAKIKIPTALTVSISRKMAN